LSAVALPDDWDSIWGSVHESAHAVVARYFYLDVTSVTMTCTRVRHRRSIAPDDDASMMQLIVSAAGNAATDLFLNWTDTGGDEELSRQRLRKLGADDAQISRLLQTARATAYSLVPTLKAQILAVAAVLREHRTLTQFDVDAVSKRRGATIAAREDRATADSSEPDAV
jgi:hypothetical protein